MGASIMEKSALSILVTDSSVLPEPFAGVITADKIPKEVNDNMIKHDDKRSIKGLMNFMVKCFGLLKFQFNGDINPLIWALL